MKKSLFMAAIAAAVLCGCSFNATLMARDSGKTYSGRLTASGMGMGTGTMTVNIDGVTYQGPAVRVASNDTFGFASAYGANSHGSTANAFGTSFASGDQTVKAIMSSSDGHGLRCDIVGRNRSAGGICMDDASKIYDVVLVRE